AVCSSASVGSSLLGSRATRRFTALVRPLCIVCTWPTGVEAVMVVSCVRDWLIVSRLVQTDPNVRGVAVGVGAACAVVGACRAGEGGDEVLGPQAASSNRAHSTPCARRAIRARLIGCPPSGQRATSGRRLIVRQPVHDAGRTTVPIQAWPQK